MKMIRILSIIAIVGGISPHTYASDIRPTTGNAAVYVQNVIKDGREGAYVLSCKFNQSIKKYSDCIKFGRRIFYTREELDSVSSRLRGTEIAHVAGAGTMGGVLGMAFGGPLMYGLFSLAPVTGGASLLGAGILLVSAACGAAIGTLDYKGEAYATSPVIDGVVKDKLVTVEAAQFNAAVRLLWDELNELE